MLAGCNPQLVVEAMVPDFFHVVPIVNDAVLDGVSEFEDSLLGLGLFSYVSVLVHADHDVLILGPSDD